MRFSRSFNAQDADLLLQSSDGRLFAVKQDMVKVASSVFNDMFRIPQPASTQLEPKRPGQAARHDLPLVKLSENGRDLDTLLQWMDPSKFENLLNFLRNARDIDDIKTDILALLDGSKKYDVKTVSCVVQILAERHVAARTATVLALGVVYGWKDLTEQALRVWIEGFERGSSDTNTRAPGEAMYNVRTKVLLKDMRPSSVEDIWPELVLLLPPGFFIYLAKVERKLHHALHLDVARTVAAFMRGYGRHFPLELDRKHGLQARDFKAHFVSRRRLTSAALQNDYFE